MIRKNKWKGHKKIWTLKQIFFQLLNLLQFMNFYYLTKNKY